MRYLLSFILILSLASTVFATDYRGECAIVFNGDSTLHGFQGKAKCEPFTVGKSDGILDVSRISADLSFALSLAGYHLKPPSVLGVIRVDDKISVTATVVLSAK